MAPAQIKSPKPRFGQSLFYVVILALVITGVYTYSNPATSTTTTEVPINELYANPAVSEVVIKGDVVTATLADGTEITANKEPQDIVSEHFVDRVPPVKISVVDTTTRRFWTDLVLNIVPFILIVGFLFLMMRQAQSTQSSAMSFGKSRARLHSKERGKTTFKDVAGVKEAKFELEEIVDFLKNPNKYVAMGAKIPRGVMLIGAPGTGKTLLARAVAGEANVPFFNISGSEFVEMFVGVGASRVRDLFMKAKRNAPCIVFIDEIDAVGRQRGAGLGGGHDEREQTLNQILVEMDGFENDTKVIVIAATNRPDVLDAALLRPGRFDRRVMLDIPDIEARHEILQVHARNKPLAKDVDLQIIASQTPGFAGADLENLMNEAALLAARQNKKEIHQEHLQYAIEKVMLGPERKTKALSPREKEITAFHEAGHAIVAHVLPHCDPVHKVSIISRGMALGATWYMPQKDRYLNSVSRFRDELVAMVGGLVAEELTFGEVTTGSSNDLKKATQLAREMVTKYGMSNRIGPVIFGEQHGTVFLGRDIGEQRNYSEETASRIDEEVSSLLKEAYNRAVTILGTYRDMLKKVAGVLVEKETLDAKDFAAQFEGLTIPPKFDA